MYSGLIWDYMASPEIIMEYNGLMLLILMCMLLCLLRVRYTVITIFQSAEFVGLSHNKAPFGGIFCCRVSTQVMASSYNLSLVV
jgi:hypothetical protein